MKRVSLLCGALLFVGMTALGMRVKIKKIVVKEYMNLLGEKCIEACGDGDDALLKFIKSGKLFYLVGRDYRIFSQFFSDVSGKCVGKEALRKAIQDYEKKH